MREHKTISIADQIFEQLERDILSGVYQRGELFSEMGLSKQLGVSRTPVREAIRRLEQEHLLEDVTVGQLTECIRSSGAKALRGVKLFDVYTGAGIPQGKKSVAFSLTLRSDEATLTDEHAQEAVDMILDALSTGLNAVIR